MAISGLSFDLIFSYLSNRYQYSCINSTKSDKHLINHGSSQGSVLGLILFLLYIDNLPDALNLKTLLFADGTALSTSGDDFILLEKLANIELKKIENWLLKKA